MNTDLIEEAKEVSPQEEQEQQNADLLSRLASVTETKTPGTATAETKKSASFWNASDDDFEQPAPAVQKPAQTAQKETDEETPAKSLKVSDKVKEGSANTAVGMFDFTCSLLFPPIHNYKLKKKIEKTFTEKSISLFEEKLIDAENSELDAQELRIKTRFESILKKHQKKIDAVELKKDEKEGLKDSFKNYFDYTESSLPPGACLSMEIVNILGKRLIDAFTAD